jgi:type 1 glutamine amidotransferase
MGKVDFVDESYWPGVEGDMKRVQVLATTPEEGKERPMAWTYVPKRPDADTGGGGAVKGRREGRVFSTILGHYAWTFDDPLARVLMLRGIAWAAGEPVDRFAALATDGVKLKDQDDARN